MPDMKIPPAVCATEGWEESGAGCILGSSAPESHDAESGQAEAGRGGLRCECEIALQAHVGHGDGAAGGAGARAREGDFP